MRLELNCPQEAAEPANSILYRQQPSTARLHMVKPNACCSPSFQAYCMLPTDYIILNTSEQINWKCS
jgi:hypothetical protein